MRLRSEYKHHLRKSADRKAQISPVSGTNDFLICAFWICRFSQVVFILREQPRAQSLFLFPIVFGINPQNDWTATPNRVGYDVFAQAPFISRRLKQKDGKLGNRCTCHVGRVRLWGVRAQMGFSFGKRLCRPMMLHSFMELARWRNLYGMSDGREFQR